MQWGQSKSCKGRRCGTAFCVSSSTTFTGLVRAVFLHFLSRSIPHSSLVSSVYFVPLQALFVSNIVPIHKSHRKLQIFLYISSNPSVSQPIAQAIGGVVLDGFRCITYLGFLSTATAPRPWIAKTRGGSPSSSAATLSSTLNTTPDRLPPTKHSTRALWSFTTAPASESRASRESSIEFAGVWASPAQKTSLFPLRPGKP